MTDAWEYLVWVDIETTGLKATSRLLEVAAVVTAMDPEFQQIGEPFARVLGLGDLLVQDVDPLVLQMHARNGLWEAAQKSHLDRHACMTDMRAWFTNLPDMAEGGRFYWAGRSLHFDLQWLAGENGASLEDVREFSHRRFDIRPVTAFLSLAGIEMPGPEETHRALDDVLGDIALSRKIVADLRRA